MYIHIYLLFIFRRFFSGLPVSVLRFLRVEIQTYKFTRYTAQKSKSSNVFFDHFGCKI